MKPRNTPPNTNFFYVYTKITQNYKHIETQWNFHNTCHTKYFTKHTTKNKTMFKSIESNYNTTQLNQTYGDSKDLFICKKRKSKSKTQNGIHKPIMCHNGMCIKT